MTAPTDTPSGVLDAAVIGAGAAGIAAARRLAEAGRTVEAFEARDRVGGRAHTLDWRGTGLDLGCGWLHSADENPLSERAGAAGFTIDRTPPPWESQAFGLGMDAGEQAAFGEAFAAFEDRVAAAARAGREGPAASLFEPDGRWNALMDAISGALNGACFSEVSILDYDAYHDSGVNWRVAEGYGRFIAGCAAGLTVHLGCAVERIDRSGPVLRIDTARGTVEARTVILTMPVSLIASGAIRIDPSVPDLLEAASGVVLGLASKLHMTVDGAEDFPRDGQLWGRTDTADTGGYHLRPFGRPMIEGYFGGDLAWGLEAEGPGALFDFGVEELVSLLGSAMRRRLSLVSETRWGVDPWSLGAYSHALPGRFDDRVRLARAIENRLFIAGEATSRTDYGTAHGAWIEGERAADQALAALGARR